MAEIDKDVRVMQQFKDGFQRDINNIIEGVLREAYTSLNEKLLVYCVETGLEWSEMVNISKQQRDVTIKYSIPDWKILSKP